MERTYSHANDMNLSMHEKCVRVLDIGYAHTLFVRMQCKGYTLVCPHAKSHPLSK